MEEYDIQTQIEEKSTKSTEGGLNEVWLEEALAILRVREWVMKEALGEVRVEQERTKAAKEKFLEIYGKTLGTITLSCDQAGIERTTYYLWMKTDPNFRSRVAVFEDTIGDMVEDRLKKQIQMDNSSSIQFYLDRRVDKFQKQSKLDVNLNVGIRSLEEQLYDIAMEDKKRYDTAIEAGNVREAEIILNQEEYDDE